MSKLIDQLEFDDQNSSPRSRRHGKRPLPLEASSEEKEEEQRFFPCYVSQREKEMFTMVTALKMIAGGETIETTDVLQSSFIPAAVSKTVPRQEQDQGNSLRLGSLISTNSEKQGTLKLPETKHRTTEISIGYEDLKQHFGRKLEDAAKSLGVSRSTLKRICRRHHGINRWPSHKRSKNYPSLSKQNPPCSDPPPEQAVATTAHTMLHDKIIIDVSTVTIKAVCRDNVIKFHLSPSSKMIELEEKVSKRLKLNVGTFNVKYPDDGDLVLIGCDEDLWDCITTSRSLGKAPIRMLVQEITD